MINTMLSQKISVLYRWIKQTTMSITLFQKSSDLYTYPIYNLEVFNNPSSHIIPQFKCFFFYFQTIGELAIAISPTSSSAPHDNGYKAVPITHRDVIQPGIPRIFLSIKLYTRTNVSLSYTSHVYVVKETGVFLRLWAIGN